jgi:dTDP-4-amino-4,6-dideoxygalactose transaminase
MSVVVPTFRPRLPTADALAPLLREIDENRWYSNFGPLVQRFEANLASRLHVADRNIVTVANATAGIALALQEACGAGSGLCMMPAWTHTASAVAATAAGLTPWFVDVSSDTWQLHPNAARCYLKAVSQRPKAIVVVSPFGGRVDIAAWEEFTTDVGIPVVVDAAGAFDTVRPAKAVMQVVSLHATKVLGMGEGGFIIAGDEQQGERLRRMTNFGLDRHRVSILPGVNAKMSEYAAAVGLVALDMWPQTRFNFLDAANRFLRALTRVPSVVPAPGFDGTIATSTANVILPGPWATGIIDSLSQKGIGARKWWVSGCHRHPMFAHCPRTELNVTEKLQNSVIGLPFFVDITDEQIELVFMRLTGTLLADNLLLH